jgi:hypothetical protein
MASGDSSLVKINEVEYSMVVIPPQDCALVLKEKEDMLGSIDLAVLVDDLGRVGNFVRIAYNGVAGHVELQKKIRRIGYDVTKLCDKSAVTVSKFKHASTSILADLQGTYQFLLDHLEDIALETLTSIMEVAKGMAAAAEELSYEFDEQSKKVEGALEDTMTAKGEEEKNKKEIEKMKRELETSKKRSEVEVKDREEDYKKAEEKFQEAKRKQEEAEKSAKNILKSLANSIVNAAVAPATMGMVRDIKIFETETDMKIAAEYSKEGEQHRLDMQKQRDARRTALSDIAEFAKSIENCASDSNLATAAINALHHAMSGLKKLSALMLKVALFWKQMQMHCESLAGPKMKRMVEAAMKKSEEDRMKVWTNIAFKKQAVIYYSKWVALDGVCGIYMERIKETQKTLYQYLEENPNNEQAKANVRQLAVDFRKDLEHAQKEIDEQDKAAEEEEPAK